MSKFTAFSEKSLKHGRGMGSDAIALNFSRELNSTDCTMRVLERLDF